MPKATTTNEVVSLDLKEKREFKKHILYCLDEFSGYMVGEVINNKKPATIIQAFHKRWIREGPGIPRNGIFSDNGGEFKNPEMKEMASKYNLKLSLTAENSPWSNGKNKQNYYNIDRTVEKLMEDDSTLTLEEAVSLAVEAHNMQINSTGFSPKQLQFGHQAVIPGITEGNPATMEPIVESDTFRKEFANRINDESIYRIVDANKRIQIFFYIK